VEKLVRDFRESVCALAWPLTLGHEKSEHSAPASPLDAEPLPLFDGYDLILTQPEGTPLQSVKQLSSQKP
jgi:hypothetical protein